MCSHLADVTAGPWSCCWGGRGRKCPGGVGLVAHRGLSAGGVWWLCLALWSAGGAAEGWALWSSHSTPLLPWSHSREQREVCRARADSAVPKEHLQGGAGGHWALLGRAKLLPELLLPSAPPALSSSCSDPLPSAPAALSSCPQLCVPACLCPPQICPFSSWG